MALVRRDDVIRTLSVNLRTMTDHRDSLQAEYMTQAGQLVEQVHMLQDQLKQVTHTHTDTLFRRFSWPLVCSYISTTFSVTCGDVFYEYSGSVYLHI